MVGVPYREGVGRFSRRGSVKDEVSGATRGRRKHGEANERRGVVVESELARDDCLQIASKLASHDGKKSPAAVDGAGLERR